jgi:two-component sensor histidine kinase
MQGLLLSAETAQGKSVGGGALERDIVQRLGMLPNLFRSAPSTQGVGEQLWVFAKSAYLDSPLPPLFKERLFVQLSRFCGVRGCIARHVAFLLGKGRPAGDATATPQTIAQVTALVRRPLPDAVALGHALLRLEALREPAEIPDPGSRLEGDLFDALSVLFVAPGQAERARFAIRNALGDTRLEWLTALLAFIRTEHYWSETHPRLDDEPEVALLMRAIPELAALLPDARQAREAQERIRSIAKSGATAASIETGEDQLDRRQGELQHRVRNALAVIRSIVRRTAETSETVEDFASHLDGRIGALSRVQLVVAGDPWAGFDLAELLYEELRACAAREGEQFSLRGPPVRLTPKAAENIGLAIHELATNAVKHGAFTAPRGRIDVWWSKGERNGADWLFLHWKESGMAGLPVEQRREGFGTILLQQTLQYDLGAEVTRAFEPGGFRCEIAFPLTRNASR